MPRKYELSWDKTHKRWIKTIDGKKHYFEKAARKSDVDAYKRSLEEYYKVIGKLDPQSGDSAAASEKLTINRRRSGSYKYISTSIAGVAERYFAYQRSRFESGSVSAATLASVSYSLEYFVDQFVRRKGFQADSVNLLNEMRYSGFNKHLRRRVNDGEISFYTAKTHQSNVRRFITWAWEERHLEEMPRNLNKADLKWIRRREPGLTSKIEVFPIDDLRTIFDGAYTSPQWCDLRIFMLLGLNCGFTQSEVGSLTPSDFVLSNNDIFIERRRPKTGIEGRWLLWTETLYWMTKRFGPGWIHNQSNEPIFLTQQGRTLATSVYSSPKDFTNYNDVKLRVQSAIPRRWTALQKRTLPGRPSYLSFKYLRKTGASFIAAMDINNSHRIAQTYLAHSHGSTAARHYLKRDYASLNAALVEMGQAFGFHHLQRKSAVFAEVVNKGLNTIAVG